MKIDPNEWNMPSYPPFFPLDETSEWALGLHAEINAKIFGQIAMAPEDAALLAQAVANAGDGNHLEIGSLFGGSAILAALTKKKYGLSGEIHCIDDGDMTLEDYIQNNAYVFRVEDMLTVYKGHSNPFPLPQSMRFASTLIDAGHEYPDCYSDWRNAKEITDKYIIFHDYDPSHMGVVEVAKEALREWRPVFLAEHTLILEKP